MIEKLEEFKKRAELLRYNDKNELDDIKRKSKMYLEKIFPSKLVYPLEIDQIRFNPQYITRGTNTSDYQNAWAQGRQELINLLDTRIEEYKLFIKQIQAMREEAQAKPKEIEIVEKIIRIEDTSKIDQLRLEYNQIRSKKTLWKRINWATLIGIGLTVIGGTFFFGKYVGETRFDSEKIELVEQNKILTSRVDSLLRVNEKLESQINTLQLNIQALKDSIKK